ncbi:3003_t:CDS:2 [Scutellospora calospora]|uniref:3003_t:CDS:1 n=1 Tax=Scutellospora calospora TaxID=85575 RepID=A0ACA9LE12_9GLOM|nr:3003_t:CDS:2 [Scutellospora calospora]
MWIAHHARKTYLNIHVKTNLEELDENGALLIVDYKMKILLQSISQAIKRYVKLGYNIESDENIQDAI